MVLIKSLIVLFAIHLTLPCGAEDTVGDFGSVEQMVKRINERYDDFFRYHRELEERWQRRSATADERKRLERAHTDRLEQARKDYVKARRARPSDEPLRLRWEAEQKGWLAEIEVLRRRYVQQKDSAELYLKKGRKIPEMKEFDLEGY